MPAVLVSHLAPDAAALDRRHVPSNLQYLTKRMFSSTTHTTPQNVERQSLQARQNAIAIPSVYTGINGSQGPGAVVGITLGAIAGFVLIVWLFSALSGNMGTRPEEQEVIVRTSSHSRRSPSEKRSRSPRQRERIIRQEKIIRDASRPRPPPPAGGGTFVVTEDLPLPPRRRVDGDDEIVVVEDQSSVEAPPHQGRRGSTAYRSYQ